MKNDWFGKVINGKMHLSEIGRIAFKMWYEIHVHFLFIDLDAFIVMPDHIHGISVINRSAGTPIARALHATPLLQIGLVIQSCQECSRSLAFQLFRWF
jgi:hypothetical protein